MITQEIIKQLSIKKQTEELNIAREYCQHIFLFNLYGQNNSNKDKILFKGGTALKFIFNSPRYSEDLDFDAAELSIQQLENIFADALIEIERNNIKINIQESKKTIGGYLGIAFFHFLNYEIPIKIEVSLRKTSARASEMILITNDFMVNYNIFAVAREKLVAGKIKALLGRVKARDFYDLYFILRKNLLSPQAKAILPKVFERIQAESKAIDFRGDLMRLLPKDHHASIKTFPEILKKEIQRFIA